MLTKMNPIDYLVKKFNFRITSNPHEYYESYNPNRGKKPFGKRDHFAYGQNVDRYCGGYHRAWDLVKAHNAGIPAVANAQVLKGTGWNTFGWTLVLGFFDATGKHYQVIYGHLNRNPLLDFKVGQTVKQGQIVAYQGTSNNIGANMASHLHIQFQPFGALAEQPFTCNGIDALKIDVSKTHATRAPGSSNAKVDKTKHLIIAGHGNQRDGSFDPGATGLITKGEHKYVRDDLFPAMKRHLPKGANVEFYDARKVSNYGNLNDIVKKYKAKQVTEIHFDAAAAASARGGHVIIHSAYSPDKYDLRLRDAIRTMTGVRYNHKGYTGISGRNNLYNVNDARNRGIAYRLIELGFGTNRTDANIMTGDVDRYAKELVNALFYASSSAPAKPAKSKTKPKPQPAKSKWKKNRHGTLYMPEKGTFTVGGTRIMSREGSPFLSAPQGGWCYPKWPIRYDELAIQDNHLWIGYTQNGKRWYLPIRKAPGNSPNNLGKMWGTARLGW